MKPFFKLFLVMVTLAAVFGFVACSSSSSSGSDSDKVEIVAVYVESETDEDITYSYTITFYDDGTFEAVSTVENVETKYKESFTAAKGTYKGDVTKNTSDKNMVTFTVEKIAYVPAVDDEEEKSKPILISVDEFIERVNEEIKESFGDVEDFEDIEDFEDMIYSKDDFVDLPAIIDGNELFCLFGDYVRQ